MNYDLSNAPKSSTKAALKKMLLFLRPERQKLFLALGIMILNSGITMLTPYLIGYTIDHYIQTGQYHGLMVYCGILLGLYLVWAWTEYMQTEVMGSIGQRMLYSLRNEVFGKLQALPVSFFNQNKSGDLIARINSDTDKVNQFFSQSLMRFVDSVFAMTGAMIFLLSIHLRLGAATLVPGVFILVFVLVISPWVKRKNAVSLKSSGALSGEIQESLHNFKTIIAFNRRDYFRRRFATANKDNYSAALHAGLANSVFVPVFALFSNLAQLIVLTYGIYLIAEGQFTIGLLISFIAYAQNFYQPLRQLAALWASFQTAMAAWDRISVIIELEPDLKDSPRVDSANQVPVISIAKNQPVIEFKQVHFAYPGGKQVLSDINFTLLKGKTYALVGPTGGGKTTTASLIARLYDPTNGQVLLEGRDIRSFSAVERTAKIGFILQEPFLFSGSLKDNILYGNADYQHLDSEALLTRMEQMGLSNLLKRFDQGLETPLNSAGESISLGQKQLIAFIRAVLRQPEILILDEATANIDTVTEQLLGEILEKLPESTTRVIIAHRLNTIENADEIFFVNGGKITPAGTFKHALQLLLEGKRVS
ncbi:ATP-binding cassette, subfamily B [Arachidicoccus rhizosphaerae]|uniref:ATP-binding cassette, subfamily B n=1 Tax=Arachidicoccus rhizosphaerae TaxID=551991 RepID=A0A1H3Z5D8_9BACT|nr:ABC transporter ATP-binding protein [Arachidicoccus rhizosphaerae]SEA18718.1 ATP-binding cassette, subfamily B [Arachidicoccus rhizosphaerae]